jgi:hypothetical protein
VTSTFQFPLAAGGPPATVWCWYLLSFPEAIIDDTEGSSEGLRVCVLLPVLLNWFLRILYQTPFSTTVLTSRLRGDYISQ